jgi:hypothetical protein
VLLLATVTKSAPSGIDPRRNRGIRNKASAPNRSEKIVFADDTVAIADQEIQNVEYLRLDRNQCRSRPQLAPLGI